MKRPEIDKQADTVSVSSSCSSVNVDGLWKIVPHCSLRQTALVMCVTFTLMQRGIIVSFRRSSIMHCFSEKLRFLGYISEFLSTSTEALLCRRKVAKKYYDKGRPMFGDSGTS